jgi:hypothetical protein
MEHLRMALPDINYIVFNKVVPDGCSNKRPDCLIDCGTFSIIIECDEHQHSGYSTSCDNVRTMTLFRDLQNRPLIMIRFNPDSYTDINGVYHKRSLNVTDQGDVIPTEEWLPRFNQLVTIVKTKIETTVIPEAELTTIRLWYNGSDNVGLSVKSNNADEEYESDEESEDSDLDSID